MATTHFIEDGRVAATVKDVAGLSALDLIAGLEAVLHTVESAGGTVRVSIQTTERVHVALEHPAICGVLLEWLDARSRLQW